MAIPTKAEEKKLPAFQMNFCDSSETLDALIENKMINPDEPYYFPDPIPSAAGNVALLGVDGRILDSGKQFPNIDEKANKKVPSAANNVALLSAEGNLVDSGKQLTPEGIGADAAGTGLYASFTNIPANSDLNDYTACGYYQQGSSGISATIANNPSSDAFILIVSNSIGSSDPDDITGKAWRYRLQRVISYYGKEYVRSIDTDGSGTINFHDWCEFAYTTDTVAAARGVVDYNKADKQIKIGWNGDSLTTSNLKYLAGYNSDGNIKDVALDTVKQVLGIDTLESGTWTPAVAGASSYSTTAPPAGQYIKFGKMVILSFQVYGTFNGSTTSRIKITGAPYTPAMSNQSSGGGHLSGYTAANNIIFTGWQISRDGGIYAVGQEITTSGTNKWGSTAIYQKASGDFSADGTLMFQTS